jgi:hypothetical protein
MAKDRAAARAEETGRSGRRGPRVMSGGFETITIRDHLCDGIDRGGMDFLTTYYEVA